MTDLALAQQPVTDDYHGFYENMPFAEYTSVRALNGSSIVHMRRSPMYYRHQMEHPTPPSAVMVLGTIIHRMVLEPSLVGEIAVWGLLPEEKVRNGGVWERFQLANDGKEIMSVAEYAAASGAAKAALSHKPIKQYAGAVGPTEVSMFWNDPRSGRKCKARIDKIIPETHTIFDLKSTRDCHSHRFGSQSYSLGYHLKMAHYWRGYRTLTGREAQVRLGAIDSKPPHESAVYRVTRDVLLQGIEELDLLMQRLDECEMAGEWPAEYDQETDLLLPTWAMADEFEGMT